MFLSYNYVGIIVTAADGEFISIVVRGGDNGLLTHHQLNKDIWDDLGSMSTCDMIQILLQNCKPLMLFEGPRNRKDRGLKSTGRNVERMKTHYKGWEKQSSWQNENVRLGKVFIEIEEDGCEANEPENIDERKEIETASDIQDDINIEPSEKPMRANLKDIWDKLKRINHEKW